ncbi:CarD family transcriptional regulator [Bacillus cereus]|uniref:CarD family transcriptional regulator n=1 Tax=Bacillus thuringiensis TaxID=1428 RepID=A0A4R4AW83_BACTU|nr:MULTISPECIES: CarD family transcriptional regulator [Bacillus cereus group]MBZ4221111.1 CarD family transcriptional regulator [Bacillus wiedmannii]MBZ4222588.1 CarD family transcriptional regulator [Bacillus wiedmannii]MBZ4223157.1 CarD family transcriptional regulator [Bacillus wiedmannii]MBZ4223170.1 CarD family transcriptional regulator [Bacillus wiedmannii]MED2186272.1 CarD family transcriptional regulator [Bacillus wiedmannii]
MFQIGDNIVYPMHGAGIIEAIEEKEFSGKKQQYYVIKMSIRNMQVMIPTGKILSSSIRPVTDILALKHIIHIFQHGESDELLPWKQRHKVNTDKIKTGEIQEGAEVVRDLMRMKKEKALNTSDKKMLDNAHEFLISELGLIKGITENQIKSFC